jgi:Xanthine dehydrogenase, molybdopterin-binding subunit B
MSQGSEDFETKQNLWPLTKPLPKIDAITQCAGEAEYVNDLPQLSEEYFASVVLAERGPAKIQSIDSTLALVSWHASCCRIINRNPILRCWAGLVESEGGNFD